MFCPNCGARLEDGALFCGMCGAPIPQTAATPEITTPPVITEETTPVAEPVEQPVAEPVQPVEQPVVEPVQTVEQPVVEPVQTVEQPVAEPVQPVEQPVVEPVQPVEQPVAEPVQTVEQPVVEPVQPVEQPVVEPVQTVEQPKKKKSKKGLVIGLSAAAAVIVAGGAVGYFCFHDDITRLIMGEAAYSKMIEGSSYYDYIGTKALNEEKVDTYIASQINTAAQMSNSTGILSDISDISSIDEIGPLLSEKKDEFINAFNGNNSLSLDASGEIFIGDELMNYLAQYSSEEDAATVKNVLDLLNSLKYSGTLTVGDVSEAVFKVACESGDFLTCEIITDKDGNTVGAFPELSDKYYNLITDDTDESEKEETLIIEPFSEAEIKRIREKICEIYLSYFDKGEITVTKDYKLENGDVSVTGTAIISDFNSDIINEFIGEINAFLANDEYIKNYCLNSLGIEETEYKGLFETEKVNGSYKVINLVDKHNNVISKRIELTDNGENDTIIVEYLTKGKKQLIHAANKDVELLATNEIAEGNASSQTLLIEAEDLKIVGENKTADGKSGKGNIKIYPEVNDALPNVMALSLDIIYSDLEKTEIFGKEINTGTVTVKIADDDTFIMGTLGMLSAFGSVSDNNEEYSENITPINQKNSGDDNNELLQSLIEGISKAKITSTLKKEGEGLNMQFSLSFGELLSLKTSSTVSALMKTAEMPDQSKISDITDNNEGAALNKALLERIKEFAEKDKYLGKVVNPNDIDDKLNELERENNFAKNYADYSQYSSLYNAESYANDIYYSVDDRLSDFLAENGPESGGVIKLYFDKDGKITVIDNAGFGNTDFESLFDGLAKSCYAEITLDWKHIGGLGVTAVLTDDMNNIPDNLPEWYNYQDKVFDWEDEEGCIGYFVVGTYPTLSEGVSTAEGYYLNLDKDINALEGYAKTIGRFTENYLRSREYTVTSVNDYVSLVLERNTAGWQTVTAYRGIWEYDVSEVFDESFVTLYLDALNKNSEISAIANDVRIELFFDNIEDDTIKKPWFVGVGVNYVKDNDKFVQYGKPQCEDYINGYYGWTGKEYLWEDAESGYYLGAGGVVYPLGTYSATTGDVLIPNNLYPGDYVIGKDIVNTYNYSQTDPFDINGVWTLTAIDGIPLQQYAEENGYNISELQKNLIIYEDKINVEDFNGINTYTITNNDYGFRMHYDDMRFADFTVDSINRVLSYKGLINGRDIVTFEFTEGYNIVSNPDFNQGSFDIASLAGKWILTSIGNAPLTEDLDITETYSIEIKEDGSVIVCGDEGYISVPGDTGFKIFIEGINYAIWDLTYDPNTDTLTDSTNGENEIYLFERSAN